MEHPNLDLMRRYSAAMNAGDAAAALPYFAEDLVVHMPGSSNHAGTYRGQGAVFDYYTKVFRDTDGQFEVLGIDDHLVSDEHAATLVRWRLHRGDRVLEVDRIALYRIEDGRIAEIWVHDRDQAAYDAFFPADAADPAEASEASDASEPVSSVTQP